MSAIVNNRDSIPMKMSSVVNNRDNIPVKMSLVVNTGDSIPVKMSLVVNNRDSIPVKMSSVVLLWSAIWMSFCSSQICITVKLRLQDNKRHLQTHRWSFIYYISLRVTITCRSLVYHTPL